MPLLEPVAELAQSGADGGSLLEHTVVLSGRAMNNGSGDTNGRGGRSTRKLPLLLAGGTALGLKLGQHLRFDDDGTSLCSLHLTRLLRRLGWWRIPSWTAVRSWPGCSMASARSGLRLGRLRDPAADARCRQCDSGR